MGQQPYLSGMRVIDFSMLTPGAFCSQILADLGATVLKVERPEGGFRCADGGWVTITASENHPFPELTEVIGRPEMGRDPANASYASRKARAAGINAAVREWVAGHDRATVEERMRVAGVCCAPVNSTLEALDDPQVQALGIVRAEPSWHADLPLFGMPQARRIRAPELGEDTEFVCAHGWDGLWSRLVGR